MNYILPAISVVYLLVSSNAQSTGQMSVPVQDPEMSVSVHEPVAPVAFIYSDYNFQGPTLTLTESCSNMVDIGFNDKASSIIVMKGRWTLSQHIEDEGLGRQITLGPGSYANLDTLGDDVLSSVHLDSN